MSREPDYPREVSELLEKLRGGIRRYVLLRGCCVVLWEACLAAGTIFALDWGYFLLERADLPLGLRIGLLCIAAFLLIATFVDQVFLRVRKKLSPSALAAVLERTFPILDSRLLTVVELADQPATRSGLSREMYERTALELRSILTNLPWKNVFDPRPLRKSLLAALAGVLVLAGISLAAPATMKLCFQRDVLLSHVSWPRETRYLILGKVPPRERLVEFRDRILFHSRGADLSLIIEIQPGAVVPERVEIRSVEMQSGVRGRGFFTRQGTDRFLYTLAGINHDLRFQIRAGDAERVWYRVIPVDPPRVDRMEYVPKYPEYTRLNPVGGVLTAEPVLDSSIRLPVGTELTLSAVLNKPLAMVRVTTDRLEVEIDRQGAYLSVFETQGNLSGRGERVRIPGNEFLLTKDGAGFRLPFRLDSSPAENTGGAISPNSGAIPIPGSETLRISLEDEQGIQSMEPLQLTLQGAEDEPPRVTTMLSGIGSSITRKAMIPIQGKITDDYGVESVQFEYQRGSNQENRTGDLQRPPDREREFQLSRAPDQPWEIFDVLPLELKEGDKLALTMTAADGDTLHGPHRTSGERYQFQVVSDEALLSLLHARELNLRQRFEQIIGEVKRSRGDLATLESKSSGAGAERMDEKGLVSRNLLGLRKNHNETKSVEQGFVEIRRETFNNRMETTQSLDRLENKLIGPLHQLNEVDYNEADQDLGELQVRLDQAEIDPQEIAKVLARLDRMIERMESILKEMRRLESFGELVEMLKSIKSDQEELKRLTEREQKRQAIEKLK